MAALLIEINFLLLVVTFYRYTYNWLSDLYLPSTETKLYWRIFTLVFSTFFCFFFLYPLLLVTAFFLTNKYYQFAILGILSHFTVPWIWSGFESMWQSDFGLVIESTQELTKTTSILPPTNAMMLLTRNHTRLQPMKLAPRQLRQPEKTATRPRTAPCLFSTQGSTPDRASNNRFTLVYSLLDQITETKEPPFDRRAFSTLSSDVSTQTGIPGASIAQQPALIGDVNGSQPGGDANSHVSGELGCSGDVSSHGDMGVQLECADEVCKTDTASVDPHQHESKVRREAIMEVSRILSRAHWPEESSEGSEEGD